MTDVGLEAVRYVYKTMMVDQEWSVWSERGFTWWGENLAQHIWADPCFEDHGFILSRIHARTDLLDGFAGTDEQLIKLMALSYGATLSGVIRDPANPSRIQLASSIYVHAETVNCLSGIMAWVAPIQATEAHIMAPELAKLLRVRPAASAHPRSGPRPDVDDMLNLIEGRIVPDGAARSCFAGEDMLQTLQFLQQPPTVLATGNETGIAAEFPYGDYTSLLQLKTEEVNPRLGHGLLMLLEVPNEVYGPGNVEAARQVLMLNELEAKSLTFSHFLGSWCPGHRALAFVSFFPNSMRAPGFVSANLEKVIINRAFWVAEDVFQVGTDYERARRGKRQATKLAGEVIARSEREKRTKGRN